LVEIKNKLIKVASMHVRLNIHILTFGRSAARRWW